MDPIQAMEESVREGIKAFGAFGLALTFCIVAVVWLVRRNKDFEQRNQILTDTLINLSKSQSADLERNTAALMALKEGRREEVTSIVTAVKELREVLQWKGGGSGK